MALTPEQQQALNSAMASPSMPKPEAPTQRWRAGLEGATLGFGDELEGFIRAIPPGSRSYEEIRDEVRAKVSAYQKDSPGEAITMELLGAIAPTAAAYLLPVPGTGPATTVKTAGLMKKAMPFIKRGMAEGAVAGYGTGEEGAIEDLQRVPFGAATGALFSGGAGVAMDVGGSLVSKVMDKSRQMFGDQASTVVGKELQRLVESTGFSHDEILQKITDGEIIAENQTLEAVVRALRAEMGAPGAKISETISRRSKETKDTALERMQKGLTPDVDGNVYRAYTASDDVAKLQERKLYKGVFDDAQQLSPEIVDTLADAVKRFPNAKEALGEIYQAKGSLVPFYTIGKNGEVKIVRMPTLEDAEIVRRGLAESTSGAFKTGKGALGEPLGALESKLRTLLDDFAPSLKAVRQNASTIRKSRDAFKMGRGSLNKNVDELSVDMERLIGTTPSVQNAATLKAFRAGAMNALRDKVRKMPTFFEKASKEGEHFNELLRVIFPDEKIDDLLQKVNIAGQAQQTKRRVMYGSPTAPQEKASDILGLTTRATQGDPTAMMGLASKLVASMRPKMSEKQRGDLVDLLLSEDPDFVRKALLDESWMAKLQDKIMQLGSGLSRGVQRGVAIETADQGGDIVEGLINLFGQ